MDKIDLLLRKTDGGRWTPKERDSLCMEFQVVIRINTDETGSYLRIPKQPYSELVEALGHSDFTSVEVEPLEKHTYR